MTLTSKFKKQYKILVTIIGLCVLVAIGIFFLLPNTLNTPELIQNFLPKNNKLTGELSSNREKHFTNESPANPDECNELRKEIENESTVLSHKNYQRRFENLHFKKDGQVFRTREFLDNGSEGDFKVFLAYSEDYEENVNLLEKSKHKPGKTYLEFKKYMQDNPNEILHQERGYESNLDEHYMIYMNGKISGFQGKFKNLPVECHFLD